MEIGLERGARIAVTVTLSPAEFARALAEGRLVVTLPGGAATPGGIEEGERGGLAEIGLSAAEVAAVCAAYGPESPGANLLWEIAQAGEDGIGAGALRELLGLRSPKALAGVFSGVGKVLARELAGRKGLFLERRWRARAGECHYRLPGPVRAAVLVHFG
jgi:hypothetical protein